MWNRESSCKVARYPLKAEVYTVFAMISAPRISVLLSEFLSAIFTFWIFGNRGGQHVPNLDLYITMDN